MGMLPPINAGSPAATFLARTEQLLRLHARVSSRTISDDSAEQRRLLGVFGSSGEATSRETTDLMDGALKSAQRASSDLDLTFQLFFCRHVDNFQIFIEELLRFVVRRDSALVAGVKLRRSDLLLSSSEQVERKLRRLSFMAFAELEETIMQTMQFDLFESRSISAAVAVMYDVRNLITHNYGIVDANFYSRHSDLGVEVGQIIPIGSEFMASGVEILIDAAQRIEIRAQERFGCSFGLIGVGDEAKRGDI